MTIHHDITSKMVICFAIIAVALVIVQSFYTLPTINCTQEKNNALKIKSSDQKCSTVIDPNPDKLPDDIIKRVTSALNDFKIGSVKPLPISTVKISGFVLGPGSIPPFSCLVLSANASFILENYSATKSNGYYEFNIPSSSFHYIIALTRSASSVKGYYLHGFLPVGKMIYTSTMPMSVNFSLQKAFDIILQTYDKTGNLIDFNNYTSQFFCTDLNDSTSCGILTDTDKGTGMKISDLTIPIGQTRKIYAQDEVPGFGKVMLQADNGGIGWTIPGIDGIVLNMNYEFASTQYRLLDNEYTDLVLKGYSISPVVVTLKNQAGSSLQKASKCTDALMASWSDISLNNSLWASEQLTLDRANQDIANYRTGKIILNVKDLNGNPVPLANVSFKLNQTKHDYNFGVFDNLNNAGISDYKKLQDIGLNYATEGYYWSITEPILDNFAWDVINHTVGVVDVKNLGFTLKATALDYLLDQVLPTYVKTMNFTTLNQTVYSHVNSLANVYKNYISVWEASNEASSTSASHGLTREEMTQVTKTSIKAIKDAVPTSFVTINNGFDWFGQSKMGSYAFGGDNYTLSVPEYLDYLVSHNVTMDGIEQQMYDGGHSDLSGSGSIDVPTYDMFELSSIADKLDSFGKPFYISAQSVSGEWNNSWKDAGYLHQKWNPNSQAEFLKLFYTLMFSKKNSRGITWWNMCDNGSFMNGGGIFDKTGKPKQIFFALRDLIKNWTTDLSINFNGSKLHVSTVYAGNYTANISCSVPGEQTKWINYDDFHIAEGETKEINFTVDASNISADMQVKSFNIKPVSVFTGDTVTLNASVTNLGPADKKNITVKFYVDGNDLDTSIVDLSSGSQRIVTTSWIAIEGTHNLSVCIDPLQTVNDPNRTNNLDYIVVQVRNRTLPVTKPNLVVTAKDIILPHGTIYQGDGVSILATIVNDGNATASSANVSFYFDDPSVNGILMGTKRPVSSIDPGGEQAISSDLWTVPEWGDHKIYVVVSDCAPGEWSTKDNTAYKELNVSQKPVTGIDLTIVNIILSKSSIIAGDNITINTGVANIGTINASNVMVQFVLDSKYTIVEKDIESLSAGQNVVINTYWSSVEGNHQITVIVDPDNRISEIDKNNNQLSLNFTVSGKGALQVLSESFDIFNSTILVIIIVFGIIALVVIIKWRKETHDSK